MTPLDPELMGRNGQLCMEGAAALGASGGPITRNAGACVQCSSCPLGCRIDAKRAAHVSYLPRAVAAGARVRAGVQAPSGSWSRTAARRRPRMPRPAIPPRPPRTPPAEGRRPTPRPWRGPRQGGDQRRRRVRHARAAAALGPGPPRARAATCTSTPPPGSGPATRRRCAAGRASCRATTWTSGSRRGSCWRRPSPRSPSAPSGCPASAPSSWSGSSDFDRIASIGVHLHDRSDRAASGLRCRRLAAALLQAQRRGGADDPVRDRARRRGPLRRRRDRGLSERRPASR